MRMPRNTSISAKPNQPRRRYSIAHGQMKSSSMSMMMKRIATVENLIAKRPSATSIGSLPHSNGAALTGVSRRGATSDGMNSSAPATAAPNAKTARIGKYSTSRAPQVGRVGLPLGVIRAPHQRPGLDVGEAEGPAHLGQLGELVGVIVAGDRQVLRRRPQVLAQREDRHADLDEIAQRRHQLVALLAQAQDDSRLERQARSDRPRVTKQVEHALVAPAVTRH